MLLCWRIGVISFSRPADSELTLGRLYELLCLLKVGSQRVKESLAVLLNVNLVLGHGLDDTRAFFVGGNMLRDSPVFLNRRLTRPYSVCSG
jgi:hypothetical protein